MEIGAQLIYQHDVYFDGGDRTNGSLYLCAASHAPLTSVTGAIEKLRRAGLWSQGPHKQVAETQKETYAQQMLFVDSFTFNSAGATLTAARYDHPKFPSNAERFALWRKTLV